MAFLLLTSGCETPDEDFPHGHETIRVGAARFGQAVEVTIGQQTDEWEFCHPRKGEFMVWIDCEETRQRAASITSIECVPAESCRDVTVSGAKGSLFPLQERFSVKVVGDIEGSRVEKTQDVTVEIPQTGIHFSPEHAFAGTGVLLCRWADAPELTFTVTLNGAPIEATVGDETRSECSIVRPAEAGTLTAVPRLVDPEVDLPPVTATVHPLSDAEDVEIHDQLCAGKREVGAYIDQYGKYLVSVSAMGMLRTSPTSRTSASLPATRMRVVIGDTIVPPQTATTTAAAFLLDVAPPPGSRVEIDLDGRIESVPLRAKRCN